MTDVLGPADAGAVNTLTTTTDVTNPTAGDTWFQDCVANNPATGTNLPSRFMNRMLQQFRRIIRLTGVPENNTDDDMLGQALQSGAMNWAGTFGGTANALTATLSPAPITLIAGTVVRGTAASSPTGAVTLNVNALGALSVLDSFGNAITAGAWAVGTELVLNYNGSAWQVSNPLASSIAPSNYQTFTSSGSFTVPAGIGRVFVRVWGGGGGGGGVLSTGSYSASGGAAGGGYTEGYVSVTPAAVITVTVGAAGTAGTGVPSNGGTGGTSSFGASMSATGGAGGHLAGNAVIAASQGTGGTGTGGGLSVTGFAGNGGLAATNGGGGAGGGAFGSGPTPGNALNGAGAAGQFPGGGGAGCGATTSGGFAGGVGAGGLVVVNF